MRIRHRFLICVALSVVLVSCGLFSSEVVSVTPARAGVLSNSWVWPVAPHVVVREFRAPASEYSAGHRGIDVTVGDGEPVSAPADGRVLFVGMVAGRGVVTVDHGGGVVSTLEPVIGSVSVGDSVLAGEVVGVVALPEVSWDAVHACSCLHIGARYVGQYVSPRVLLEKARPSVLKPWGAGPGSWGRPGVGVAD